MNRNGDFTIRGINVEVDGIDILAIRPLPGGKYECRHIEVQVSINPITYHHKDARGHPETKLYRPSQREEARYGTVTQGVHERIFAKLNNPRKVELKNSLCPGSRSPELVVERIKHEEEFDLLCQAGITIHRLTDLLKEMIEKRTAVKAAV